MFRNNLHTISHYKKVMARYEEGKKKTSLEDRGFKHSYGDEPKPMKLSNTKLGKYFYSLSVEEQREVLKKMNEE